MLEDKFKKNLRSRKAKLERLTQKLLWYAKVCQDASEIPENLEEVAIALEEVDLASLTKALTSCWDDKELLGEEQDRLNCED